MDYLHVSVREAHLASTASPCPKLKGSVAARKDLCAALFETVGARVDFETSCYECCGKKIMGSMKVVICARAMKAQDTGQCSFVI